MSYGRYNKYNFPLGQTKVISYDLNIMQMLFYNKSNWLCELLNVKHLLYKYGK